MQLGTSFDISLVLKSFTLQDYVLLRCHLVPLYLLARWQVYVRNPSCTMMSSHVKGTCRKLHRSLRRRRVNGSQGSRRSRHPGGSRASLSPVSLNRPKHHTRRGTAKFSLSTFHAVGNHGLWIRHVSIRSFSHGFCCLICTGT